MLYALALTGAEHALAEHACDITLQALNMRQH